MAVWRMIAHNSDPEPQLQAFLNLGFIAIGWSLIGDLRRSKPTSAAEMTQMIRDAYPDEQNCHLGGPSLWRFYETMAPGDLVILNHGNRRRAVMRVTGPYEYASQALATQTGGYHHRRTAEPVEYDPNTLWKECGSRVAPRENIRWTLTRCQGEQKNEEASASSQEEWDEFLKWADAPTWENLTAAMIAEEAREEEERNASPPRSR